MNKTEILEQMLSEKSKEIDRLRCMLSEKEEMIIKMATEREQELDEIYGD